MGKVLSDLQYDNLLYGVNRLVREMTDLGSLLEEDSSANPARLRRLVGLQLGLLDHLRKQLDGDPPREVFRACCEELANFVKAGPDGVDVIGCCCQVGDGLL